MATRSLQDSRASAHAAGLVVDLVTVYGREILQHTRSTEADFVVGLRTPFALT